MDFSVGAGRRAILLEPGGNPLAQKLGHINAARIENAQVLARIAIGVRVAALVVRHAALQRIVGRQLGQCGVPRHGGHVQGAGKAAQAAAGQQIAAIVVLLQYEGYVCIDWDEFAATAAGELLSLLTVNTHAHTQRPDIYWPRPLLTPLLPHTT